MADWEQQGPEYYSKLQREIILDAADMLRPGGKLLYSTCTFSELENEGTIQYLLEQRPDMKLIPCAPYEGLQRPQRSGGLCEDLSTSYERGRPFSGVVGKTG